jgi:hypothetical protein
MRRQQQLVNVARLPMDGDVQELTHGRMLAELRHCKTTQCVLLQKKHSTAQHRDRCPEPRVQAQAQAQAHGAGGGAHVAARPRQAGVSAKRAAER